MTVPVIGPPRMIYYRIEANAVDVDSIRSCPRYLLTHIAKPIRSVIVFDPGLCNDKRFVVSEVELAKYVSEWPIDLMVARDLSPGGEVPLIVKVVIQSDYIECLNIPAQLRFFSAGD